MTSSGERQRHEVLHGKHLVEVGDPEQSWNWSTPAGRLRAQRRAQLLIEAANLKSGKRVLEIGCGTGLFTELMAVSGANILAVDISPDLLEIAQKRNLPDEHVEFRLMSFEDGDIDEPFDAIVGSSILHHLDIPIALNRIFELLVPGGVIAFAEPNMLNPQIWAERNIPAIRRRLHVSPDETAIVRRKLARELTHTGFTDIHIRNVDWLHPRTPKSMIRIVHRVGLILEQIPLLREFSGSVLIKAIRPHA
jgi:2-polyprenyl-3-methyl-5-hydroxy-6-metoxy-1,4-benzoquinol methylase